MVARAAQVGHPEVAATLTNLGIVQQQLGEFEAARGSQQRGKYRAAEQDCGVRLVEVATPSYRRLAPRRGVELECGR
jgi:hypothetical protein